MFRNNGLPGDPETCPDCGFPIDACECATLFSDPVECYENQGVPGDVAPEPDQPEPPTREWEPLPEDELRVSPDELQKLHDHDTEREQPLGEDPVDDLPDTVDSEDIPETHTLKTSGLLSYVDSVESSERHCIGHVYMTEWDDTEDVLPSLSMAQQKPGISVLLRSSPGSYHLHNLSVRPFEAQIRDIAAGSGDLGQVRWAARRGYMCLRVLPKKHTDGTIYKPAPEVVKVFDSESQFPQSRRHLEFFEDMAPEDSEAETRLRTARVYGQHELVGNSLRIDHYQTITDELKDRLGRE